jgi:membrane-associated protease RseP (regulator of RpoE activity)
MRHLAAFVFLITTIAVYGLLSQLRWHDFPFASFFLTAFLAFFVILVHELGHALAARSYGRRILSFAVMPFELRFRPLRLRLAHNDAGTGDLGGFVLYEQDRAERRRERVIISLAGPAANLLLAAAALLFAAWLSARSGTSPLPALVPLDPAVSPPPASGRLLPSDAEVARALASPSFFGGKRVGAVFAEAFAALSIGTGIANLIPFRGSDGEAIVNALFPGRSRT